MKKLLSIIVTVCALACAVGFWLVGGSRFRQLQAGPETLAEGEGFSQGEGKYLSYEAAYPIASCVEEYYSGDPDRVRTTGYVVYDEARRAFLYVVVSDRDGRDLEDLMWNLHLAVELRQQKDMTPAMVEGTLEPMDEENVKRALGAMAQSEIIGLYTDFQGEESYMEAYFGDEYGEVMADMCANLETILGQTDWYRIENGVMSGGLQRSDVWICILAAGLSLLIFVIRLAALFMGGNQKKVAIPAASGSKMEAFYRKQSEWVQEWCEHNLNKGRRLAYLAVVGSVVIFVAIGVFVKVPTERIIAFYLSLGLLVGEIVGAMFWYGQKGQSNPDKILKRFAKNIGKALPDPAAQEAYAEDILQTGKEWEFGEETKEGRFQGVVGSRYWTALHWNGMVMLVEAGRVRKVERETISGQVRSGKVRVSYHSYAVRFYYRYEKPKKACDAWIGFDSQSNERHFIEMLRKRTGENVEFASV